MKFKALTAIAALMVAAPALTFADPDDDTLVIEGQEMVTKTDLPAHMEDANMDMIMSGWHFRSDETQALQMDDFDNPGMIFVDQALDNWESVEGSAGKSCASCHEGPESLAGVRATYPKWNEDAGEVRTIAMQVNSCRTENMGAEPYKYDSTQMAAMEALITLQSRGMPVDVAIDGPAAETWEKGQEIYYTRYGQLELSCASCHEENYGNMIRADHLSQGQINGFPTYRLKNAKLNTVHGRFKGCVRDTRAETFSPGSPEFVALELYVASRGNGLSVEGPSVRN
ncbi:sulfur oxidation c-type cytochrome SoxA [Lutimaribacter sp. EGI FJ00015]|uniref:Sulfur oxidation c-type cytochrome SoxA n=1 Tax=Lutimaribacter degradans TaxID=2945989 RepID=A0ACC5ZWZ3_9RHOB|nr:sulfur oxidation c-type cytochrome SoxA [Lutimaribacter sp. EGI FJ00013]MCM2562370.1 sulfur oxidation c-type cytochrome SoxA [Lutimaribacter sp. EGI FJ00013]MCO0613527.1 sulfur oxidation c-type cytochrome SoxA [Lutimaribacter sp. EGI FJ00015]MCO0636499.1 sulfur oxidation c-type cytochrome SoxA [Lutimaribacter sp. EGI FJ00014]